MAGSLYARARFMAGLLLRVASRALPRPVAPPADNEALIEAIQTGNTTALAAQPAGFANGCDAQGNPWFFIALETGSLAALHWFLAQGASPTAPDRAGRLPLQVLIERANLADEFDDHLPDCPAMVSALIKVGADPSAHTLQGIALADLAQASGLFLT